MGRKKPSPVEKYSVVTKVKPGDFYSSPCPPDVRCEWCLHTFTGSPKGVPLRIQTKKRSDDVGGAGGRMVTVQDPSLPADMRVIHVVPREPGSLEDKGTATVYVMSGTFCAWECVISYSYHVIGGPRVGERYLMVENIVREELRASGGLKGRVAPDGSLKIRFAPPREALKMLGGSYTIEKFRSEFLVDSSFVWEETPLLQLVPNKSRMVRLVTDRPYVPGWAHTKKGGRDSGGGGGGGSRGKSRDPSKGTPKEVDQAQKKGPKARKSGVKGGVVKRGPGRKNVSIKRREQPMRSSRHLLSSLGMIDGK